jgi:hypothetical protein
MREPIWANGIARSWREAPESCDVDSRIEVRQQRVRPLRFAPVGMTMPDGHPLCIVRLILSDKNDGPECLVQQGFSGRTNLPYVVGSARVFIPQRTSVGLPLPVQGYLLTL